MTAESNADGKPSEKVVGEEGLRKVECLRGRLLAERAASRNAKEEGDQLQKKLIELETRLKEETKSRNRAERRLKSLMKKLESLEIFFVSDESERSGFLEKTEISSAASVASTSTKEAENLKQDKITPNVTTAHNISEQPVLEIPIKESSSFPDLDSGSNNVSQISVSSSESFLTPAADETAAQNLETPESTNLTTSSVQKFPESSTTKMNSTVTEVNIANSSTSASMSTQNHQESDSETERHSSECSRIIKDDEISKKDEQELEPDDYNDADNSLAIVAVDLTKKEQRIDPIVLDATVKEVLDALKHAKEKLQTSMERRRRMIRVG